ncbi:putative vacuolar iron transporter Ccc1 [Myriangium duriaei CBS 260.36]|uniref:Vacuolar iron transporter Ccc1 n=1 Tax=Myriangium duriaei CBS 260.36 TaxID=1168546 RepID=A0A9P4MGK4_9PEZI|nr:putative vacuolar iron transporter Ccc1 [Myriangium duriaei CBS 260.36]
MEKSRQSSDLESLASTDASTLLEEDRVMPRKESSSAAAAARVVSDAIIGLSDGLTVPFALTAGLSALGDTRLVIYGGVAELIAGAISMGLGGYLAAKSEEESYRETYRTTQRDVDMTPFTSAESIRETLEPFELPQHLMDDLVAHLTKSPQLLPFLMQFHHNMPEAAPSRAITCAMTIAGGYFLGGFIPLLPYFLVQRSEVMLALYYSLAVMALALFAFGYGKTCFVTGWKGKTNIWKGVKGGSQMMIIGGIAAACAMGLVRLFNHFSEV